MKHLLDFKLFEHKRHTYKEYLSTFTHDGKEYDLNKMFKLTKDRKVTTMPISKLKWILKYSKISKSRLKKADTDVPVLIGRFGKKWVVYDGAHRLKKAILEEKTEIKVIKVPKYILLKCSIEENNN